ncbi:hypothetical protein ACFYTG_43850 [Streptomyces mirabilis]|uniref:hypothetical protein n=1 Tax=Streptomyces mirabilis TaxID=68239 RepID=UPI00369927D6
MRRIVQAIGTLPVPVLVAPMGDEEFTIITDIDELAHRGRVTEPEPWFAPPGGEVQPGCVPSWRMVGAAAVSG